MSKKNLKENQKSRRVRIVKAVRMRSLSTHVSARHFTRFGLARGRLICPQVIGKVAGHAACTIFHPHNATGRPARKHLFAQAVAAVPFLTSFGPALLYWFHELAALWPPMVV